MLQQKIKPLGELIIVLKDKFGIIKDKRKIPNLVVSSGKNFIASRMIGNTQQVMSHMAIGSSPAQPVDTDVSLGSEIARVQFSSVSLANNVITYVAVFPENIGTGAITEAGIFNANNNGIMLSRATFAVINKEPSDILTITWNIAIVDV